MPDCCAINRGSTFSSKHTVPALHEGQAFKLMVLMWNIDLHVKFPKQPYPGDLSGKWTK